MSRLVDQIKHAIAAFSGGKWPPALIGRLVPAAHQAVRAARNVDFLADADADADDTDRLHGMLLGLRDCCVHRSEDAANHLCEAEGVELVYAASSDCPVSTGTGLTTRRYRPWVRSMSSMSRD